MTTLRLIEAIAVSIFVYESMFSCHHVSGQVMVGSYLSFAPVALLSDLKIRLVLQHSCSINLLLDKHVKKRIHSGIDRKCTLFFPCNFGKAKNNHYD